MSDLESAADELSPESALERQYRELCENYSSLKREREAVQEESWQLKEKLKKSKFQMYDLSRSRRSPFKSLLQKRRRSSSESFSQRQNASEPTRSSKRTTIDRSLRQPPEKSMRPERDPRNAAKATSTHAHTNKLRKEDFPVSEKNYDDNKMMAIMSLRGRSGKVAFMKTRLYKIICDAVLSSFDTTTSKVNEYMAKYLKYAPEDGWRWEKEVTRREDLTSRVQCCPMFGLFF